MSPVAVQSVRNAAERQARVPERLARSASGLDVRAGVVDCLLDRGDLLGFFIRDFNIKLFFQRHHELDEIEVQQRVSGRGC